MRISLFILFLLTSVTQAAHAGSYAFCLREGLTVSAYADDRIVKRVSFPCTDIAVNAEILCMQAIERNVASCYYVPSSLQEPSVQSQAKQTLPANSVKFGKVPTSAPRPAVAQYRNRMGGWFVTSGSCLASYGAGILNELNACIQGAQQAQQRQQQQQAQQRQQQQQEDQRQQRLKTVEEINMEYLAK